MWRRVVIAVCLWWAAEARADAIPVVLPALGEGRSVGIGGTFCEGLICQAYEVVSAQAAGDSFDADLSAPAPSSGLVSQHSLVDGLHFGGEGSASSSYAQYQLPVALSSPLELHSSFLMTMTLFEDVPAATIGGTLYYVGTPGPGAADTDATALLCSRLDCAGSSVLMQAGFHDPGLSGFEQPFSFSGGLPAGEYYLEVSASVTPPDGSSVEQTAGWSFYFVPEPESLAGVAVLAAGLVLLARRQPVFDAAFRSTPR